MSRSTFRMMPLVVGLGTHILLAGAASDAVAGALPADPCALLKAAEIQALAPSAKIGTGVSDASMAPIGTGCTYTWGPRTKEWGESALTITVIDTSKAYPGMAADMIQQGLLAKIQAEGPSSSQVSGVGDAGAFSFEARTSTAMAEALLKAKGLHLAVSFHAGDSLANKDKIIALLKAAAARL